MALFDTHGDDQAYDVVICGGGLAGAALARQLTLTHPGVTVVTLDRQSYPVPAAAYKVGESSVEIAGFYFAQLLALERYMDEKHLRKHGLRYFWNGHAESFARRPELGLSAYTPCKSYQIDRGVLENDLFRLNTEAGVRVMQDVRVEEIDLRPDPGWHEVTYLDAADTPHRVRARWVVDAMGRRRFLQQKLGLGREVPLKFNAVWLRVKGRLDLEDFVPGEEREWHDRVPGRQRYYSTNHLMGEGYWVWLIPLGSGNTSVGIVTAEEFHDFGTMDTLEKAMGWLERHEPTMAARVAGSEFMDFLGVRHFNYSSTQALSADRWACVGEAAAFSDPFYSPGSNLIGFANTIVTHLVGEDRAGRLRDDRVRFFNEFVLSQNDWLDYNIHTAYAYFGEPLVMSLAFLWDAATGWGIAAPQMFNSIYLDEETSDAVREATREFYGLALQVKQLLIDWRGKTRRRFTFDFIDYYQVPFINEIYARNLVANKPRGELVADHRVTMQRLEEFAQVIFLMAVRDTLPERFNDFGDPAWVNAWAVSLEPGRWEADGLFRERPAGRSLEPILGQVERLYRPAEPAPVHARPTVHVGLAV